MSIVEKLYAAEPFARFGIHFGEGADSVFVSYPQLIARTLQAAAYYREQGVSAGQGVLFPFDQSISTIESFLGLLTLGAVPYSVPPRTLRAGAHGYADFLSSIVRRFEVPWSMTGTEADAPGPSRWLIPLQDAVGGLTIGGIATPGPHSLAFVQFSSGSTATPKGIPITHGQLSRQLAIILEHDRRIPGSRVGSWLPLYHDMGLIGGFLSSLFVHGDLYLETPQWFLMNPVGFLHWLAANRIEVIGLPCFALKYVTKAVLNTDPSELAGLDLSCTRQIYLGSDLIEPDAVTAFASVLARYGLRAQALRPSYGMAEAVLMVSCCDYDSEPHAVSDERGRPTVCVGRLAEGYRARIRGLDGKLCSPESAGELEIQGGTLAGRYLDRAARFYDDDGFYATGDIAFMRDGQLYICGRIGDRLKINGESAYAQDLEQIVEALPFVRQTRVCALEWRGDIAIVFEPLSRTIDRDAARCSVIAAVFERSGIKLRPQQVVVAPRGTVLRTTSGKLRRADLALKLEESEPATLLEPISSGEGMVHG